MAVATKAAPAAAEDKKTPISRTDGGPAPLPLAALTAGRAAGGERAPPGGPRGCLVGTRALDDPGAFGVEHNDALVVRDLGWMLCWVDSSQEALDTTLVAYRVAEVRPVLLPLALSP